MSKNLNGKKLLILGGSYVDRKIIEAAKKLGVITYITDNAPIDRSPAKIIADFCFTYSADNIDEIINLCKSESIDGVLSLFHDFSQIPYRIICEKMNFPCFGNFEQFKILTDKLNFKKFCEDSGIDTIPYFFSDDLKFRKSEFFFPLIVKPSDGRGSKGQTICNSYEEIVKAVDFAKKFSKCDNVVIEKYLGQKNDLELAYLVINGEPILQKISDRYLGEKNNGLDKLCIASIFPSKYFNFYRDEIDPKIVAAFKKLKLVNAPIFVQGFFYKNEIKFYDPGLRLPGDDFDVGYKNITNIDISEIFIKFALTGKISNNIYENIRRINFNVPNKFVAQILPCVRAGKIFSINGLEDIENNPKIVSKAIFYRAGDVVGIFNDSRQRFAEFIIVDDSIKNLKNSINRLFDTLKVFDENGNDMLIEKFDPNLLDV